ncbi:MAG: hypothetical protein Ta2A_07880 [Treponemataceae bacterium]|nr:MAG: hypothetical protein Ta2A_07880 [Treponemataceae bacterium]
MQGNYSEVLKQKKSLPLPVKTEKRAVDLGKKLNRS